MTQPAAPLSDAEAFAENPAPAPVVSGEPLVQTPQVTLPPEPIGQPQPAPPQPEPAPVAAPAADPEPEPVADPVPTPTPGTEVAVPEDTRPVSMREVFDAAVSEQWAYDVVEYRGDKLGARRPEKQALAAYALSMSKFVPMQVRNDINSLFIVNHLSPASYERVMFRLINPNDPDYTEDSIGELMELVVDLAVKQMEAEAEAAKVAAAAAKK